MWKNLIYILIFLNIIIQILSDDISYILSNTGNKGVGITSFNKNLYLLSSSYIYNIINENYLSIKNNINSNPSEKQFYKNFEMIEASINIYTNESVFLIAEHHASNNKINLYSFNITSSRNAQNPKLIYSKNSVFGNARISLINVGIDKYLLSYIINENTFESIWFEYTYYEGFEILKTFTISNNNIKIITGMSCFLLYDQFPICFYSTQDILTNQYSLDIEVYDTVFVRSYLYGREKAGTQFLNGLSDIIYFTKAIYLSQDHAVFCYMETNELKCDVKQLSLNFETLGLTLAGGLTPPYSNSDCKNDINKIDILKIDNEKFIVGYINNANDWIYIDLITVSITAPSTHFNTITKNSFHLEISAKTTLTLFLHEVYIENNYYGIIFDDANENKVKYIYLDLPYCSQIDGVEIPLNIISLDDTNTITNTFTLGAFFEIKVENSFLITTTFTSYKIISFSAKDDDNNIFIHEIEDASNNLLQIGDVISGSEQLTIKPLGNGEFHSGKFFIEVAPKNEIFTTGVITGKNSLFEFEIKCYEGCSTCKKYDSSATSTTNHNCVSCKSSYYSMGDLCLKDCSLIKGFHNVDSSKTCKVNELEVSDNCFYNIWEISQTEEINECSYSSYCPEDNPYVYALSGECIDSCRYSEFEEGECLISNITGGGEEAINIIRNQILSLGDDIFDYINEEKANKSITMFGHNITIEITDTMRLQKDINNNLLVSNILDISKCENQLRQQYTTIPTNEELIILKIDLRRNDTASTQIEYQIYNKNAVANDPLDISQCKNIIFKSPLWFDDSYKKRIKELYDKKINIFDIKEKFYSDLCYPYHEIDFDADMTPEMKQRVFYYYNANLCEKSCTFIDIDINTYKAICDCPIKTSIDLQRANIFEYIEGKDQKIVYEEKVSNIKAMKCFKYVFSKDGFKNNWGSYFMMLMILGFIIVGIFWFKKGQDMILKKIRIILDTIIIKLGIKHDAKFMKKFEELKEKYKEKELEGDLEIYNKENANFGNNNIDENNNIIQVEKNNINEKEFIINSDKKQGNEMEIIRKKGPQKNILLYRSIVINKEQNEEEIIIEKKEKEVYLTDIEKDLLSYENAKKFDKRTFCGYYWSLLKLRQLIIFTFFSFDDFNLFLIKLLSFFLLLSFNLVYNAIFFFDKVINDIYDDKGKYSLKLQILNIFISSILFSFTIILIRFIITCHKKLIKLKNMDVYEEAQKESFAIHKFYIILYIIYYIVGSVLLLFFWYFITSFGAIFQYTQDHCFLNAFISFCFSMIYPFIYLLIPAWFRYLALKKNYERLYCVSQNI